MDDSECSIECSGKQGEACGGKARLSVYTKSKGVGKKRSAIVAREVMSHVHQHQRKHVAGGRRH